MVFLHFERISLRNAVTAVLSDKICPPLLPNPAKMRYSDDKNYSPPEMRYYDWRNHSATGYDRQIHPHDIVEAELKARPVLRLGASAPFPPADRAGADDQRPAGQGAGGPRRRYGDFRRHLWNHCAGPVDSIGGGCLPMREKAPQRHGYP